MRRFPAFARRSALALLLGAQLAGTGVPLADARLDAAAEAGVHIEARTERSCDPVHLHGDCVLCQHLSQRDTTPPPSLDLASEALASAAASTSIVRATSSVPAFLERGRAPPTA